jgi:hypothetical protein
MPVTTQANSKAHRPRIYFSDFFNIDPSVLEEYGAFNISLINDLPLFIDPFLLFNSPKPEYQRLHADIIRYVQFLRDESVARGDRLQKDRGLLDYWYAFKEVRQNWLGYSRVGNSGSALGRHFAMALNDNLRTIFTNFGEEDVAVGTHLEKLYLVAEGVGRDNISDFTTSLIKGFLLEYSQEFARTYLPPIHRRKFTVPRTCFNYKTKRWEQNHYELPVWGADFVLLTPKDILTREEIWINRDDLYDQFEGIAWAIPNLQLRALVNDYFRQVLPSSPKKGDKEQAVRHVIRRYPEVLEYYIRDKEEHGDEAVSISHEMVEETETLFVRQVREFVDNTLVGTDFYRTAGDSLDEARQRALFLKHVIEDRDGYRFFYVNGQPVQRESDLQILYLLTWFASPSDVNREVNNGRGPVDYKISRGRRDKSLVEFKLASNTQLRRNLENQVAVYEKANETEKSLKVIMFFTQAEEVKVVGILNDLNLTGNANIILIDAGAHNKPSASKA